MPQPLILFVVSLLSYGLEGLSERTMGPQISDHIELDNGSLIVTCVAKSFSTLLWKLDGQKIESIDNILETNSLGNATGLFGCLKISVDYLNSQCRTLYDTQLQCCGRSRQSPEVCSVTKHTGRAITDFIAL